MCSQRVYSVAMPDSAWRGLRAEPSPQLMARVRDELGRVAAEAPPCPAPGGNVRTIYLEGGYVVIASLDYEACVVTLVEVARTH